MLCVVFVNDTATTEIYTLSLHDALPIYEGRHERAALRVDDALGCARLLVRRGDDAARGVVGRARDRAVLVLPPDDGARGVVVTPLAPPAVGRSRRGD